VSLGLQGGSRSLITAVFGNGRRIIALRRAIQQSKPDIVLSLMNRTNVLTVFAMTATAVPVIVSEHTAPNGTLSRAWGLLRELAYRRAAFVVMLTTDALAQMSPAVRRRGRVIPNPLPSQFLPMDAGDLGPGDDPDGQTIMGLGRLAPEKGFDVLIEAFARLATSWPRARLVIWGEGEERERLERLRDRLGMTDRIQLPGATTQPERELLSATVFVLSSRLEGLPMTLLEAMALGRAVIACDCDYGPRDIVRDGVDGVLVPPEDAEALAVAIAGLLSDGARRGSLARRAAEVRERFAIGTVSAMWEDLYREAARHP
jgi:glycosyltransferase involved in cell wall biosynthesis